jgi:hypothetical protein
VARVVGPRSLSFRDTSKTADLLGQPLLAQPSWLPRLDSSGRLTGVGLLTICHRGHPVFSIKARDLPLELRYSFRVARHPAAIRKQFRCRPHGTNSPVIWVSFSFEHCIVNFRCIVFDVGAPTLIILGVYRPEIDPEAWKEQWEVTEDDDATREHFRTLVLIEAVVGGLTDKFDMGKFGQLQPATERYPSHMQVGYDEGLLSRDGETLIDRCIDCVHGTGPLRFAVYLHMFDPSQPLLWQCGQVVCPPVQDAPVRLLNLMPYRACD